LSREPSEGYTIGSVRIDQKGLHRTRRPQELGAVAKEQPAVSLANPFENTGANNRQTPARTGRSGAPETSANRASRIELEMRRASLGRGGVMMSWRSSTAPQRVKLQDLVKIKGMSSCLGKGVSGTVWKVQARHKLMPYISFCIWSSGTPCERSEACRVDPEA
jgi:hypothetical protein